MKGTVRLENVRLRQFAAAVTTGTQDAPLTGRRDARLYKAAAQLCSCRSHRLAVSGESCPASAPVSILSHGSVDEPPFAFTIAHAR